MIAGTVTGGALVMLTFGLGTVPALVALGFFAGRLRLDARQAWILRQVAGAALVLGALTSVALGGPDGPFCIPAG